MNDIKTRLKVSSGLIEATQWVPRPLDEVFAFFSDENNLEAITPKWLSFHVVGKSTPNVGEGTEIDYRLRLFGVPMRWKSRIEDWSPGKTFVDTQLKGPYAYWHHTHTFAAENGGTRLGDRVVFRVPLGKLGDLAAGLVVRAQLRLIFAYRQKVIAERFGQRS